MTSTTTDNPRTTTAMLASAVHDISLTIHDAISTNIPTGSGFVSNASTIDPTHPSNDRIETNDVLLPTDKASIDYFYNDFVEDSTQSVYDLNDFSLLNSEQSNHPWIEYNVSSAHLNQSDLHIKEAQIWDPTASFLEGVVEKLFLVPLAFILGLCIGVIIWGILVYIFKLCVAAVKWLKKILPEMSSPTCTGNICAKQKGKNTASKSRTIWYEPPITNTSNYGNYISIRTPTNLSENRESKNIRASYNDEMIERNSNRKPYLEIDKDDLHTCENGKVNERITPISPIAESSNRAKSRFFEFHQQEGISNIGNILILLYPIIL